MVQGPVTGFGLFDREQTTSVIEEISARAVLIAWATIGSADPDVKNSGVVRFDDKGGGWTGVEISLAYDPPAGRLGEAVAALFSDPQTKVERAVAEFKRIIETR